MVGTFINMGAIAAGSIIGVLINKKLPDAIIKIIFQGIGLFTIALGVSMSLKSDNLILLIFSIILGGVIGELIRIEKGTEKLGSTIRNKLKSKDERFSEGLTSSFLLFCIGSMSTMGALEEGLKGSIDLLLVKSLLDGVSAIALASALGLGVGFSIFPLLLFQGGITIFASLFKDFFNDAVVNGISAVGGILLIGLGVNILELKKLKVLSLIPSLIVIVFLSYFFV